MPGKRRHPGSFSSSSAKPAWIPASAGTTEQESSSSRQIQNPLGVELKVVQFSSCNDLRLQVNKRSDPVVRQRGMALAGQILGKKDITGAKRSCAAVADTELDSAGQRDAPLAARRVVPAMQIFTIHIVLKNQSLDVETGQKMFRSLVLVEIFEMRLAVRSGVDSAELHATSKAKF